MEKIKGMCRNEACEFCDEIFEVEKTDFRCPHCSKELFPIGDVPVDGPVKPKAWKKMAIIGTAAAALLGGAYFAFSGGGEERSITLNKTTASVYEGDIDTLKAIVKPEDAGYTLKWASNNPDVATVDNGIVTFHTSGEVKIGVQVNEKKELKAFCDYTVEIANWIKIMDGNQTMKVGETKQLSLDCDPGDANEPVIWTSSNPDVVTVEYGKLTAIAPGTAKIIATTKVGEKTDDIKVIVKGEGPVPVDLGYAKYEGDTKNGKPHGNGTMTFKETHVVPGAKGNIEAKTGEYAIGSWRNGEVNLVTLYQKNGNQVKIMHK